MTLKTMRWKQMVGGRLSKSPRYQDGYSPVEYETGHPQIWVEKGLPCIPVVFPWLSVVVENVAL